MTTLYQPFRSTWATTTTFDCSFQTFVSDSRDRQRFFWNSTLLSQAVFHQSCFISAATALGSVPRLDLCHVKCKGKMLSEMESIFFKTANLNQEIGSKNWFIQEGGRKKKRQGLLRHWSSPWNPSWYPSWGHHCGYYLWLAHSFYETKHFWVSFARKPRR